MAQPGKVYVPDFVTPLRDRIVDVMEHLADVIYSDPDVVIIQRH